MEKAFNIIPTRLLKEGFLLPPGEGQEEGVGIKKKCLLNRSPTPRFALPNPLGFGFLRRSTAYIPVGVPVGEGV